MILELAVLQELHQFSVKKITVKKDLTIALKKVKSKMKQSKTGLAHRDLINVQLKKMSFSVLVKMENGLTDRSPGVKTNQLQHQMPKTGIANIMLKQIKKLDI